MEVKTKSNPDELYFKKLFTTQSNDEYRISGSCLSSVCTKTDINYRSRNFLKVKDVIDTNMKVFAEAEGLINNFAVLCGVTWNDVITCVLLKLANESVLKFPEIQAHGVIDINSLGWMKYHGLSENLYSGAIGFVQKEDIMYKCIICLKTKNFILDRLGDVTISPKELTGGRMGMRCDDLISNHFVIWSRSHVEDNRCFYNSICDSGVYSRDYIYYHSLPQYGHAHCHVISGTYFSIRTWELLDKIRKMVDNHEVITMSEFYLPIQKYYSNLDEPSKNVFLVSIFTMVFRISLNIESDHYVHFITLNYNKTLIKFAQILSG